MKEIQLTQGKVALVDDSDFDRLNSFKWYAIKAGRIWYATRNIMVGRKRTTLRMHWYILGGKGIDHIDHNGLNNQKSNLRFCTRSENAMNMRPSTNCTSTFKGVSWHKTNKKWMARIGINGKDIYLGTFTDESEAARIYDRKANELFGKFSFTNL